jgi:membrane protein implicated in regulation of membrane protease activity
MTALYLFAAAAGVPLVLYFLFSGEDAEDGGGADEGIAGVMFRLFPLSSWALAAAVFGITGLAMGATGVAAGLTAVIAVMVALVAGAANSVVFSFLRRSESTSDVSDDELAGTIARVVLPVAPGRRGRIALTVGGRELYLSADAMPDTGPLERGQSVVVVEVRGGVARISGLELP